MNELDQNNINKGEEHGEAGDKVQNQDRNNNNHTEILDNEGSYNDSDSNNYDSNDNNQHGFYSTSNTRNEHNIEKSDNDNDCDPNDIGQDVDAAIRIRNYNMGAIGKLKEPSF